MLLAATGTIIAVINIVIFFFFLSLLLCKVHEAVKAVTCECGLKATSGITTTNMRKYTATLAQVMPNRCLFSVVEHNISNRISKSEIFIHLYLRPFIYTAVIGKM